MMKIYKKPLDREKVINDWYEELPKSKHGAFITFVGIVRDEEGISGLSFDIYKPILKKWFKKWKKYAKENNSMIFMAHSTGDVGLKEVSFIAGVSSPKRRFALETIDKFVEDFKNNAPIWKYDLKKGKRVYAEYRSSKINGSGLLL